ncbi:YciI family protein [Nonomuraea sp. NPDC050790]|uniref:YciI family protein n=1 Tax=Nonomuraea sp. NPDC050790 TaxID=3364371 RepID=UPI00379DA103
MKYAMLVCGDMSVWEARVAAEAERDGQELGAWFGRWGAAGKLAEGGAELQHPRTARTVRPGANGELSVHDGPYMELKEVVGGVVLLEADDLDEAISIAATWPGVVNGIATVEVRPLQPAG